MLPLVLAWPKNKNIKENPYNYLIYKAFTKFNIQEFEHRKFNVEGAAILHAHWPDRLLDDRRQWRLRWRFTRLLKAIKKLKKSGGKLIWTVHNLQSREVCHPKLAEKYLSEFIGLVDGLIFLSASSQRLFADRYGIPLSAKTSVIPHPHYAEVYENLSKEKSRLALRLRSEDRVIGFFGKIRSNKGLDELVSVFNSQNIGRSKLLLAGSPNKRNISSVLMHNLEHNPNIVGMLRHIEDEEVGAVVGACDAMIFPYQNILNSGSAMLALSLGRPIIVPNMGSFPELQEKVGREWVYLYDQPFEEQKLKSALEWVESYIGTNHMPDLSFFDPKQISEFTEKFYRDVLS